MKTLTLVFCVLLISLCGVRAEPSKLEPLVECPKCKGTGEYKCTVAGCANGMVLCPGHCLKRERGSWVHMKVEGHPDTELWQRFNFPNGQWQAWTQAHIGEKIELRGDKYVNTGKCEICKGTTRVKCSSCRGANVCPLCGGALQVLKSERDSYVQSHSASSAAETVTPANGLLPEGQVIARRDGVIMIKTKEGRIIKVKEDGAKQSATGAPATSP